MYSVIIVLSVIYVAIVVFMAAYQRQFLYLPDKQIAAPEQYGLNGFRENFIKTSDNVSIQTLYKPAQGKLPTILYFHGNASHMGNRAGIYSALAGKGFGVMAVSYRGYGKSEGTPTEQGLYNDARAAISYLTDIKDLKLSDIILYGESLGTGVAVQMATEKQVAGVVLQAPYTSTVNRAAEIYFFIPVTLIMTDRFESIKKIENVKSPLLILHGELDATIPIRHGKKLFATANEPKQAIFFPDVEHNNFDSSQIAEEVFKFAEKYR